MSCSLQPSRVNLDLLRGVGQAQLCYDAPVPGRPGVLCAGGGAAQGVTHDLLSLCGSVKDDDC